MAQVDHTGEYKNSNCIQGVMLAARQEISSQELYNILDDLSTRVEEKKASGLKDKDAYGAVFKELLSENDNRRKIEAARILRNGLQVHELMQFSKENIKSPEDIPDVIQARIGGLASIKKFGRFRSADLRKKVLEADLLGRIGNRAQTYGVKEAIYNKMFPDDVASELYERRSSGNSTAVKIADSVKPAYQEIVENLQKNFVPIENDHQFITSFYRDPEKLLHTHATLKERLKYRTTHKFDYEKEYEMAYQRWKTLELAHIDHSKTFQGVSDIDKFMRGAYKNLTIDDPLKRDAKLEDIRTFGPLGVQGSKHRVIFYKSGRDFAAVHKVYGRGDLYDSIEETVSHGSKLISLAENFGTSPYQTFGKWLEKLKKLPGVATNQKLIDRINRQMLRFDELTGRASIPVRVTTNNIVNWYTIWQAVSKLGGSVTTAFNDLNYYASSLMINFDANPVEAWSNALSNYIRHMRLGARKADLEQMGYWQKRITSSFMSRFTTLDGKVGMASKVMQKFMNLNFIHWHDNMLSGGIINDIGRYLFRYAPKRFENLPDRIQSFLSRYDIQPNEWDLIRKNAFRSPDGRKFITPDDPLEYKRSDIEQFLNKKDISFSEAQDARINIRRKIIALMRDESQFVYLEPDITERSQLRFGSRPGTLMGSLAKLAIQFHTWPYAVARRVIGRMISDIAETPGILPKIQKGVPLVTTWIAGNMITGYIAQAAINLASGKEPPDPTKFLTWAKCSLGAAGIYGDLLGSLIGQQMYGNSPLFDMAGPGIGEANTYATILSDLFHGKWPGHLIYNLAKNNWPGINLIYTRLALNYLLLWQIQEKLFPGSLQRQIRNAERNQEPPFLISPTSGLGV